MIGNCSNKGCDFFGGKRAASSKNGYYRRSSDRKTVNRYQCRGCKSEISTARRSVNYRQKKRHLNGEIWRRSCSSDPNRRIARDLKISRRTVERKLRWLRALKEKEHKEFLEALGEVTRVYVDDMKSFIHTNCRPVTISMAVSETRKILGFTISRCVPNSRRLIEIATKKYGAPVDETQVGFRSLLEKIKPHVEENAQIITDKHPLYPNLIRELFPKSNHIRYESRPASVVGFDELKTKGWDPLFPINQTFAMIRAHVARLARSTWCTSKTIEGLATQLTLYMHYHNSRLT